MNQSKRKESIGMEYLIGFIILFLTLLNGMILAKYFFKGSILDFFIGCWLFISAQIILSITVLSILQLMDQSGVFWFTVVFSVIVTCVFRKTIWLELKSIPISLWNTCEQVKRLQLSRYLYLSLALVSVIIIYNLFVAIYVPPNNNDAVSYHLPRILHWLQNNSVDHYFTNDWRQNSLPVNSSVLMLWTVLVSQSWLFVHTVQWISLIVCFLGIVKLSLLASLPKKEAIICGLIFLSFPMVVLQSSTAQNDLVVSAYSIMFIYFGMQYLFNKGNLFYLLSCGISFGLAMGSKLTFVFLLPGVIIGTLFFVKKQSTASYKRLTNMVIVCLIGFLIFGVYNYALNYKYEKNIIASHNAISATTTSTFSLRESATSLARYGYQMVDFVVVPDFLKDIVRELQVGAGTTLFSVFGLDTTGFDFTPIWYKMRPHEDLAGFGLLGLGVLFGSLIFYKRNLYLNFYSIIGLSWFLCFSILIPWTTYKTRYFILPMAFLLIASYYWIYKCDKKFLKNVIVFIAVFTLTYVSLNSEKKGITRILTEPRKQLMYLSSADTKIYGFTIIRDISGEGKRVGLQIPICGLEYLIWNELRPEYIEYLKANCTIQQQLINRDLDVAIASKRYPKSKGNWIPIPGTDWVIAFSGTENKSLLHIYEKKYDKHKIKELLAKLLTNNVSNNSFKLTEDELNLLIKAFDDLALKELGVIQDNEEYVIKNYSPLVIGNYSDNWVGPELSIVVPVQSKDTINMKISLGNFENPNYQATVLSNQQVLFKSDNIKEAIEFTIKPSDLDVYRKFARVSIKFGSFKPCDYYSLSPDKRDLGARIKLIKYEFMRDRGE
ncbi:ArnT family glycosyltransferase [Phosphitispora sp. TUW77]|uniref:ArnT family glycosyltransferase n=1 Tax=Phosphitispora sp. TUW77 TaxID=3152361 RepID=UPI003AB6FAD0